jgi:hypothetical protein
MTIVPKLTVECAGDFRIKVLPNGRVQITMEQASGELSPEDVLYDKRGAAQRLGTTVRSIDNFMNQKKHPLPYIRHAGRPKFRERDILWWLDQGCSVAARRASQRAGGILAK